VNGCGRLSKVSDMAAALKAGDELADHGFNHAMNDAEASGFHEQCSANSATCRNPWIPEITQVIDCVEQSPLNYRIVGFRKGGGGYFPRVFEAIEWLNDHERPTHGIWYDSSLFAGPNAGGSFAWPYTFDQGCAGCPEPNDGVLGLWSLPMHGFLLPPDLVRTRGGGSSVVGIDLALWFGTKMSADEALSTLKYTLDKALETNRSPLVIAAHDFYYSDAWAAGSPVASKMPTTVGDRRAVLMAFVEYALSKPDVRIVNYRQLLAWLRQPSSLVPHG